MKRWLIASLTVFFFVDTGIPGARENLRRLTDSALEWNPRVRAARHQVEQATAGREELEGFFDPRLSAGAEHVDSVFERRETWGHAGFTAPVVPGVYLNAALEEHYFSRLGDMTSGSLEQNHLIRSVARVGLNVPLLQDRGWRQWKASDMEAQHAVAAASNQWLAVCQEIRREVEQRYLRLQEANSLLGVAKAAVDRSEKLLAESEAMAGIQALPEYQVFAARAAAALRREEQNAAQQACDTAELRLAEVVAAPEFSVPHASEPVEVIDWASDLRLPEEYNPAELIRARGNYARIASRIEAERSARERAVDQTRSKLELVLESSLQGEDPDDPVATDRYLTPRNYGVMAGLVWSRPWDYSAEKSRVRIHNARLAEWGELLRQAERETGTELAVAHNRFIIAHVRLRETSSAVDSARMALNSEDERFRLGEGRSRNVLDAQKDLTDALKRQIVVAVELLRAYYEFNYAAGYSLADGGGL